MRNDVMMPTYESGRRDNLIWSLAGLVLGMIFLALFRPTHSGNVSEYQANEIRYQDVFRKQEHVISTLRSSLAVANKESRLAWDSVAVLAAQVAEVKPIYIERRRATDARPDSANLAMEVAASRLVIDRQEDHINALLNYTGKIDAELATARQLIAAQDTIMNLWPERHANMMAQKDAEIKAERRRGNKKFGRGLIIGGIAGLVIGFL